MDIADCYQLLELNAGASMAEIKAAYRQLARRYHPDTNPGDKLAHDKFVNVTIAYQQLIDWVQRQQENQPAAQSSQQKVTSQPLKTKITRKQSATQSPPLSLTEEQLKWNTHHELQKLWKYKRFSQAIALAETLAQRLPQDPQVRSWQAFTYQRWGRQLIQKRQQEKARSYLRLALKTDPHNRSLWSEVERDFRALEKIFR